MKWWRQALAALLLITAASCGGDDSRVSITIQIAPTTASVTPLGTIQFIVQVGGSTNQNVTWAVNDVVGGNNMVGTISTAGLYTAPAAVPNPNMVTIKATPEADTTISATGTLTIDSGITVRVVPNSVTVGTTETFQFTAQVSGTGNQAVTWQVNDTDGGGAATGTIDANGLYTAPATTPSPSVVTVRAISQADTNKSGTAAVGLVTVADPTLEAVSPTRIPQGSLFADLYLSGTNLLSTSTVRFGGTQVPSSFVNINTLRVRVPADLLLATGMFTVNVQRLGGVTTASFDVEVFAVRPAIAATSPGSVTAGDAVTVTLTGGFFPAGSVTAQFNGQPVVIQPVNPVQVNTVISSGATSVAPGLYPITVQNPAAMPPQVGINLAVQPLSGSPSAAGNIAVGTSPANVAVNTATGIAVVTNRGSNNVSLVDLATSTVVNTVAVGNQPVGVGVDNLRNVAVVANNAGNSVSIIDLATATVTATLTDVGMAPFSVGVNPLSGRAIVARQSTNTATIIDLTTNTVLGTVNISTGDNPAVAIEPGLNWAIVTPGGSGLLSIVDLGRQAVVAQATVSLGVRGVAINTESREAFLTDPTASTGFIFSLLDQTVANVQLELGHLAAAINPYTDIAVTVEFNTDSASVIDLRTRQRLGATIPVGADPRAVAIDPGTNTAVVVNEGSDNITLINLGAIRSLHVEQLNPPASLTSATDVTVEIVGTGFVGGSQVRLDGTAVATTVVSDRRLTATVPAAMLTGPRRYALDVLNPGDVISNIADFVVVQAVTVGTAPRAVAIDRERNLAVVANAGSNDASVVDLATGMVTNTIAVGTNPQGVAVLSRDGRAVVTNRSSSNASLINLVDGTVTETVAVGGEPLGVTISDSTRFAFVANSTSNTVSTFSALTGADVTNLLVDTRPVAVAFDDSRRLLAVAHAASNNVAAVNPEDGNIVFRVSGLQVPTDIIYDPASDRFIAVSSLSNNLGFINPDTSLTGIVRAGLNPTGISHNPDASTLITANTASRTLTVIDLVERRVRAVVNVDAGTASALNTCRLNPSEPTSEVQVCNISARIVPSSNIAVIVDEGRDRILLFPLPR